jgi:dTDP-4-dehydrorhamnose reductase
MNKKILILGDGLLGKELCQQSKYDFISRHKDGFDITSKSTYDYMLSIKFGAIQYCPYDTIINTIAYTDTYSDDKDQHWNVNYKGVADLVDFCNYWNVKLVHIVTDYIYANSKENATEDDVPVHCNNWYGYTKLLGDAHIQLKCKKYLLIRSTHKAKPFKHESAWIDQKGNFDYVDIISSKILNLIDTDQYGIFNVGTDNKTMFELASQTNPNVKKGYIDINSSVPYNVTMNIEKESNI